MARVTFADSVPVSFGVPWRPPLTREQVKDWDADRLQRYLELRKQAEQGAIDNPVGQGWTLPMWEMVMEAWPKYQNIVILGGNRSCVRADTMIYDPILMVSRRIDSIKGNHHVYSCNMFGEIEIAEAIQPFTKPAGEMLRVTLSNGVSFVAALDHAVLMADLTWKTCRELREGFLLYHLPTNSGNVRPSPFSDDRRYFEKALDSQYDYRPSCRLCDELLLEAASICQGVSPLPDGVPKHIFASCNSRRLLVQTAVDLQRHKLGVLGNIFSRIPVWNKFYHLATRDDLNRRVGLCADSECRAFCKPCKSVLRSNGAQALAIGQRPIAAFSRPPQSTCEFEERASLSCCVVPFVVKIESAGIEVKWDMTVPSNHNYIVDGVVHHNTKSSLAARLCVDVAEKIPEAEIRAYHVSEERSISDQQAMIYEALPQRIKDIPTKKGRYHSLQFAQKNGFTDNICILPPLPGARKGAAIRFGNYRQYQQDAQIVEGFKAHLIWGDEEMPQRMFETLQYRSVDYHGRILLTFTTLTGWTPLIQDILGKTRTLKTRDVPEWAVSKLGRTPLPIMQESLSRPGTVIFYFWTEDNAFIDTSDFIAKIQSRSKEEILARAFGIPTKSFATVFPKFNKEVNVIPHEKLPWLEVNLKKDKKGNPIPYRVTPYMAIDPAGSKNWFMVWVAIDAMGTRWVYREWPDYDDWALPGNNAEGKPGPAQKGTGKGIRDYVEMIKEMEKEDGMEAYERFIDPRMGAAERQSEEGATTIISDLDDAGMTVIPAPGVDIDNGIQLINNLLDYDDAKPRDSLNSPKLYVSDRCTNLIYAMSEYTGMGGRGENVKDPIDCLRYMEVSRPDFIDLKSGTEQQIYGRTASY